LSRLSPADRFGVLRRLVPSEVSNAAVAGAFQEIAGLTWPQTVAAVREYQDRQRIGHTPQPPVPDAPPLVIRGQGDFTEHYHPARGWTPAA
jgi:hypothetical protein